MRLSLSSPLIPLLCRAGPLVGVFFDVEYFFFCLGCKGGTLLFELPPGLSYSNCRKGCIISLSVAAVAAQVLLCRCYRLELTF
ncbi:hypothetical protein BKA57DRAFT_451060 [Linnemannia elongata]|nr:hypothetical protein BKA57DRAFT_451060 [Linnemannia elongata]